MSFEITKVQYSGAIKEVTLGEAGVKVGGESSYPFFTFEGEMPHKPKIAMEVWDMDPGEAWPDAVKEPFAQVLSDPGAWAKKCVESGADMIIVQLKSTDPNDQDNGADAAIATVEAVLGAVDVPVIVYGVANKDKDIETLSAIAEKFQGKNLVLGPVEEHNHKQIGAQALAYGHVIAANTPIDVNLAKQLNILLGNLGVGADKILIDPTTGGLGYGMEYCYSVMERMRMAALVQQDDNLQQPIINNMSPEVWKCKEAGQSFDDVPTLAYQDDRGILMEATQAVTMLLAGSDVMVMRHPEAVKIVKAYIDLLADGGTVDGAFKEVQFVPADKLPQVDFTPSGPPEKVVAKKVAPAKAAPAKAAPKPEAAPKAEAKPEPAKAEPAKVVAIDAAKTKVDAEAAAKAEADAKAKAEVDAAAKAEAAAKADADAKAKAEADAKAKTEADAAVTAKAKAEEEDKIQALRTQRAKEREELEAKRAVEEEEGPRVMKKADKIVEPEMVVADKLVASLTRVHMRVKKY